MLKHYLFVVLIMGNLLACSNKQETTTTEIKEPASKPNTLPTISPSQTATVKNESEKDSTAIRNINRFEISMSQVGPLKIGMPVAVLKKIVPPTQLKAIAITKEGQGYQAYEIRETPTAEKPAIVIEEKCEPVCQVWRLHVMSLEIKTEEGLGIGSSLGEVRRFYNITYLGAGETEIVAVAEKEKITFLLDVSHLPEKEVPKLNKNNTPDDVKIKGMFIL